MSGILLLGYLNFHSSVETIGALYHNTDHDREHNEEDVIFCERFYKTKTAHFWLYVKRSLQSVFCRRKEPDLISAGEDKLAEDFDL